MSNPSISRRSLLSAFVAAAAIAVVAPNTAQAQTGWQLLGQRTVMFRADRDTIPVTAARGMFRRIQFEVLGNGVEIFDVRVNFGNGTTMDIPVRQFIAVGGRTRVIDLPGDLRVIRTIDLVYRTRGVSVGRALVRAWGSN